MIVMTDQIIRLYPTPAEELSLSGLYLSHNLRARSERDTQPYIYANFVTSLDGRIAVQRADGRGLEVPKQVANPRDWRLFQELAAQADLIISSGRYLREWADGRAQEILQVDDPRYQDLREWRVNQGLSPQPDIAIISGSLRFPIPDPLTAGGRKFVIFTIKGHPQEQIEEIEARGGKVYVSGTRSVDGVRMAGMMAELGYRTVYSAAGPKIHHLLLRGKVLDRLYMTLTSRMLGGEGYASIVEGGLFQPPADFRLSNVYYDSTALDGVGQLFLVYDRFDRT